MLESLPMHSGPMSCYTVCAITIMISSGVLFATIYVRYNSNEFRRVENWVGGKISKLESDISKHDEYIDVTNVVINQIHIDLAVQESSMKDLKSDIAEIKADIKTLLGRQKQI